MEERGSVETVGFVKVTVFSEVEDFVKDSVFVRLRLL